MTFENFGFFSISAGNFEYVPENFNETPFVDSFALDGALIEINEGLQQD